MADKMADKNSQKLAQDFYCKICDYKCSRKNDIDRHYLTAKHKRLTNADKNSQKLAQENPQSINVFVCDCGKSYKHRQSLHKHQQKCKFVKEEEEEEDENIQKNIEEEAEELLKSREEPDYKSLLVSTLKQMSDQQNQMTEILEENKTIRKQWAEMMPLIGNNNNNTNNFNLNFFLNEKCKDALNITDFIDSLRLQLNDLEYTADNGHVKGITNIFNTALSNMEVDKRPMHCTDLKREVLYIKDNDEWQVDEDNDKLKDAVDKITNKNICNTNKWLEKYPGHKDPDSKDFEKYVKMTNNSMGTGDENEKNKIVKNIMKEVTIDKTLE